MGGWEQRKVPRTEQPRCVWYLNLNLNLNLNCDDTPLVWSGPAWKTIVSSSSSLRCGGRGRILLVALILSPLLCSALTPRADKDKDKDKRKVQQQREREKKKKETLRLYSVAPYALKQTQMDGHRVGGCANHRRVSAYAACVPERQL